MGMHFRIDNRLLHGQVLHYWCKHYDAGRVVIVSDDVMGNPIQQGMMRIVAHGMVRVDFAGSADAWWFDEEEGCDRRDVLFLFKNITELAKAVEFHPKAVRDEMINGGVTIGTARIHLSEEDECQLKQLMDSGIGFMMGALPEGMTALSSDR